MYYPYFRARQFELIALRELAEENETQGIITPILEPVKERVKSLDLAYKVFLEQGQSIYLILNPRVGEMPGDNEYFAEYLNSLEQDDVYLAAFLYDNNANYINRCIQQYELTNCMIICSNDIQLNEDFRRLAELPNISSLTVEDPGRNRELSRYIGDLNKSFIRLDDFFEKQSRNSDFLSITEHKFSEEHLYYSRENFAGFSDYTVLPNDYSDSGGTPRAVVINMTYLNDVQQIWIRHFTSETNDSIANVQGKFAEAAEKAVDYFRREDLTNSAIEELIDYFERQHYPGLGVVKKISMKNHLLTVGGYLKENLDS